MSNLNKGHIVETLAWISIVLVFYLFSFEFDQEIEIYRYGATGWPRSILIILLLVTLGNLLHTYKKGFGAQIGRVGISDDQEEISYDSFDSIKKLIAILALPLIYAMKKTSSKENKLIKDAIKMGDINHLPEIIQILHQTNAINDVRENLDEQINSIDTILKKFQDNETSNNLRQLASFIAKRKS